MSRQLIIQRRLTWTVKILVAIFLLLTFRLAWVQLVRGQELAAQAKDIHLRDMTVQARRGMILDRNRKELAMSVSAPTVVAIPPEIKYKGAATEVARQLAEILGQDYQKIYQTVTKNGSWVYVQRKVDFARAEKIARANLPGIEIIEENQRFYPRGALGSQVLGLAGIDNQGLEGLELVYDKYLRGEPGYLQVEVDAVGREIPQATHKYILPQDGDSLVLTLDETLQYLAEQELEDLMASPTAPKRAAILAMDPRTGEILAMAMQPTFDPNKFQEYPTANRRNWVVSDTYEPGSAFKIITVTAAVAEGVVHSGEKFYDPGYIRVGRETIKCWRFPRSHGSETFAEGVANSCNPVFVTVGLRLEEKQQGLFYKYIRAFGIGSKTGIDLNGEATGQMIQEDKLRDINIATISIGQSIAVTPIQMVTMASAVANGGRLLQPHLVKEVIDGHGEVVEKIAPRVVRQVVSPEVAEQVSLLLEGVVAGGTGSGAAIEGYRVAGKTGTAQKPGPGGYQPGKYVASFLGFAPVGEPRLAVLVVIDEPQGVYFGGQIAAPIFKHFMEQGLHYLGVPPRQAESQEQAPPVAVPPVMNLPPDKAARVIRSQGLEPVLLGRGEVIVNQVPGGLSRVAPGTRVLLYLGQTGDPSEVSVPDVTGLHTRETAELLEMLGLKLEAEGSGQAVEQDPVPGTVVPKGQGVKVRFAEEETEPALGP
ncbi:MAG: PASTA domain-containing protein [Clostridia bacterium]|nr:MAG: PASTA domain-containing protein [Clostridia bacterium]